MAFPFIPSPHFSRATGRAVDLVVLHTMEAPETGTTAESVARYFQTTDREVSSHYCIDADSIVQCVREDDVAWCAPGANHNGIHLEHAGYARQTAAEWDDAFSTAMLDRSAELTADLCSRYGIPVTWLQPADLLAGKRGITTHNNVTQAFHRSTHTDPGKAFPIERYLELVRTQLNDTRAKSKSKSKGASKPAAEPRVLQEPPPLLEQGATGWQVKRLQRLLDQRGVLPGDAEIDGDFGPVTETAVKRFQKLAGLEQDGIVGQLTWQALVASTVRGRRRSTGSRVRVPA